MGIKWKAFGFQRGWPGGSVWTEDDGPDGTWSVKCSGFGEECDDVRNAKGCYNFPSAHAAMRVADAHVEKCHSRKAGTK